MSTAATSHPDVHDNAHNPHLAHHFDTPEQQFASGKLGMWVFLATEILMFGGLFCAYAVYRHNHSEVFEAAHTALNKWLGGINTIVLITSSLTMAWGVRAAQLGAQRLLAFLLFCTLLGGFGFMGIKAIEYRDKWHHHLGLGESNKFRLPLQGGAPAAPAAPAPAAAEHSSAPAAAQPAPAAPAPSPADPHRAQQAAATPAANPHSPGPAAPPAIKDPNAGTPDAARIHPAAGAPRGLSPQAQAAHHEDLDAHALDVKVAQLPSSLDRQRVYTFFQIYFVMTGLHGIHVLVGMALIFWLLLRSVGPATRRWLRPVGLLAMGLFLVYIGVLVENHTTLWVGYITSGLGLLLAIAGMARARSAPGGEGEFGPQYFTPVDLVGLYWHLVDLIWIFLFPLLYLIH